MRHRFEPSRLLLGLVMIVMAVLYLLDVAGKLQLPFWALLIALPVALFLAGCVSLLTFLLRRARGRRREPGT
ncbi:hypothetical protein MMF93_20205 [Streptomyces tubbatahanensis]|uniref:DUF4175 domain-containing protein n=1 Tax=Streptomyces tubbatahanensis TaxID=2923272 RepID=A0ABY3XVJ7_9ACTN|nr:hypothetical protein [Streptomyces tubbatahanensis]UNS98518.1 hypothetical protein MMF93_20205 [Streptomyces tubbatahanensis]